MSTAKARAARDADQEAGSIYSNNVALEGWAPRSPNAFCPTSLTSKMFIGHHLSSRAPPKRVRRSNKRKARGICAGFAQPCCVVCSVRPRYRDDRNFLPELLSTLRRQLRADLVVSCRKRWAKSPWICGYMVKCQRASQHSEGFIWCILKFHV